MGGETDCQSDRAMLLNPGCAALSAPGLSCRGSVAVVGKYLRVARRAGLTPPGSRRVFAYSLAV